MPVHHQPDGFHTATPYLICKDAKQAIDFYKKAFNATELLQLDMPDGEGGTKLAHGEIKIGDSPIMLSDEHPDMDIHGPQTLGGTPVSIMLYVEDVDAMFAQALTAGAKELRPVKDQFYGDRSGTLQDPFGHQWTLGTHKEDIPPEELEARMKAAMGG